MSIYLDNQKLKSIVCFYVFFWTFELFVVGTLLSYYTLFDTFTFVCEHFSWCRLFTLWKSPIRYLQLSGSVAFRTKTWRFSSYQWHGKRLLTGFHSTSVVKSWKDLRWRKDIHRPQNLYLVRHQFDHNDCHAFLLYSFVKLFYAELQVQQLVNITFQILYIIAWLLLGAVTDSKLHRVLNIFPSTLFSQTPNYCTY